MKAVLISVQPQWCELIARGKKTIEVRKTRPKIETPFKCYIYMMSKGNKPIKEIEMPNGSAYVEVDYKMTGKVIGEFVCNRIDKFESEFWDDDTYEQIKCFYKSDDPEDEPKYCYDVVGESGDFYSNFALGEKSCLTWDKLRKYIGQGINIFYGWHISDLKIYDKPKEISAFKKHSRECYFDNLGMATPKCSECTQCNLTRPPQSYCFVEALQT